MRFQSVTHINESVESFEFAAAPTLSDGAIAISYLRLSAFIGGFCLCLQSIASTR
jgi:hypothetical protein